MKTGSPKIKPRENAAHPTSEVFADPVASAEVSARIGSALSQTLAEPAFDEPEDLDADDGLDPISQPSVAAPSVAIPSGPAPYRSGPTTVERLQARLYAPDFVIGSEPAITNEDRALLATWAAEDREAEDAHRVVIAEIDDRDRNLAERLRDVIARTQSLSADQSAAETEAREHIESDRPRAIAADDRAQAAAKERRLLGYEIAKLHDDRSAVTRERLRIESEHAAERERVLSARLTEAGRVAAYCEAIWDAALLRLRFVRFDAQNARETAKYARQALAGFERENPAAP